jgi:transketolase
VYLRFAREKTPLITTLETPFTVGKAQVMWESEQRPVVAVFATGPLLYNALVAAKELEHQAPSVVVNISTIKPLDAETILTVVKDAGAVVTVEEHQIMGGMGSAIAELLASEHPVPIEFIGVHDQFGQSGEPKELLEHYGMDVGHIAAAIKKVIQRK